MAELIAVPTLKPFAAWTAADWARIRRDWAAWWAGELDRPMVIVQALDDPRFSLASWNAHLTALPLSAPAGQIFDGLAPQLAAFHYGGDAFPKWHVNSGPGVLAAFLGSPVVWMTPFIIAAVACLLGAVIMVLTNAPKRFG